MRQRSHRHALVHSRGHQFQIHAPGAGYIQSGQGRQRLPDALQLLLIPSHAQELIHPLRAQGVKPRHAIEILRSEAAAGIRAPKIVIHLKIALEDSQAILGKASKGKARAAQNRHCRFQRGVLKRMVEKLALHTSF